MARAEAAHHRWRPPALQVRPEQVQQPPAGPHWAVQARPSQQQSCCSPAPPPCLQSQQTIPHQPMLCLVEPLQSMASRWPVSSNQYWDTARIIGQAQQHTDSAAGQRK